MKQLVIYSTMLFLAISCQNAVKDTVLNGKEEPMGDSIKAIPVIFKPRVITESLKVSSKKDLFGYWVGDFIPDLPADSQKYLNAGEAFYWDYTNKITISIDSLNENEIYGHSIVAGNLRPFKGLYLYQEGTFSFSVAEPGDNKYDGTFEFNISDDENEIIGKWKSYKHVEIPKRKFSLKKRLFKYDPSVELDEVYIDWKKTRKRKTDSANDDFYGEEYFATTYGVFKNNPSVVLLTSKDLENLTKADLFIMRNSIYARHGYSFKKRQLHVYFDRQSWYMPVSINIKGDLTVTEKENIKLILRYEKNAEEYYDEFGRG